MQSTKIVITAMVLLLSFTPSVTSEIGSIEDFLPQLVLGCYVSFFTHEAAHYVVGNSVGKLSFEYAGFNEKYPFPWTYEGSDEGLLATSLAGFQADLLLREYYLQKRPQGAFWQGIFWYSCLHHANYLFDDGGDVGAISQVSGVGIGEIHTILAILLALDIYRYYHPKQPFWFVLPKGIALGFSF